MSQGRTHGRAEATSRRERILEETLRIVGERGYHGFGIQELAERCGLTKPGLLHHFGSKDQLLLALLRDVDAREAAELSDAYLPDYEQAESPEVLRATFREALKAIVARALERPALIRLRVVLRVEAINADHPAHDYFVARQEMALKRLLLGTNAVATDPLSLGRQILATLAGLEEQWLREAGAFDLQQEWTRALERLLP